jgi:cell division protease FtsH
MSARMRRRFRSARKRIHGVWLGIALVVLVGIYVGVLQLSQPSLEGDTLRFDTFAALAQSGRIDGAEILDFDSYVVGTYTADDGTTRQYNAPYLREASSRERLIELLLEAEVPIEIDQQPAKRALSLASVVVPALMLVAVFIYLLVSYNRGTGLFKVRSGARHTGADEGHATFADVAGQDQAVTELKEIRDFLSDPGRFAALGAQVPKGILLFGPPGCGKTLLARAVAGEAGASFYSISGSDFVELYAGVGAARVRDLFAEARENVPAIVFIDELDSVGRRRGGGGAHGSGSREEQEQALNQILTELDGFSPLQGIIVIGATNRPDILDTALLRPGRFDRTIGLERPDEAGRRQILAIHAENKPLNPSVDLDVIAQRAIGLSGADLANVVNEGALLAARAGRSDICQDELEEALQRILEAPERQRRLSQRSRSFGRSTGNDRRVTFADVAGVDEAIEELAEVREYLAEPQRFVDLGARPPRGFLLVGPPGCGKTMLARAVAVEANAAFFSVAATEFVEVYAGEGAGRVRDLFAEARAAAPSIVFLDEIDAVGTRRGASVDGQREREQTLNQILVELDGFEDRAGVIVMAASNRPEILDPALVRPGRFDRRVVLDLPDRRARAAILAVHAQGKRLAPDVDLGVVAGMTRGLSGADLANLMNEATLLAARQRRADVSMKLLEEAVERVGTGIARAQSLTDEDRTMVAYHEMGHALVGRALPGVPAPRKVSIVARGRALGATWNTDDAARVVHPRSVLIDQMAALLGGRAAEVLVFGEPGSGAADDLERVSQIARQMVCELGMSETLGQLAYREGAGPDGRSRRYSEEAAATIDAEVRQLVDTAYARATAVLTASTAALDRAARALLEQETLSAEELDELCAASIDQERPRPAPTPSR